MKLRVLLSALLGLAAPLALCATDPAPGTNAPPDWLQRPLSLSDALTLSEKQNATLLKAKMDLLATAGIAVQTKAIVLPKLQARTSYQAIQPESIDKLPIEIPAGLGLPPLSIMYADQSWGASIQLVQSLYEGGRMASALRTSRLLREQSVLHYQATLADTLLDVRVGYYDALLAAQQIEVQQASVELLTKELEDTQRRFDAGTVPKFNVLRAEVELANARPKLIRARNAYRIAKNNLVNLLGFNLPTDVVEDIPLTLTDRLEATPVSVDLPAAIQSALANRPELGALRKSEALHKEAVVSAKAGYLPRVQVFGGYGARSSQFSESLEDERHGWSAGAQLTWDIFDGAFTRGKVGEAKALHSKSQVELEDTGRRIELEVRTRYSQFIEAKEVLEATQKVQEQAVEALRLANSRADAGTGTQLDVLNAQTSLTEARSIQSIALRDYATAWARLERAMGSMFRKPGGAEATEPVKH